MREVTIAFSSGNGDGLATYLIDVGGAGFDGSADRKAIHRALEGFDKASPKDAITHIYVRWTAQHVLKPS